MGNASSRPGDKKHRSKGFEFSEDTDAPPPYSISDPALNKSDLARLAFYDTVFIVDDSGSMNLPLSPSSSRTRTRWHQARDCLMKYAEIAARYDADGVDIYFLNDTVPESKGINTNLSSTSSISQLFDTVVPRGETPIGQRLQTLVQPYLNDLRLPRVVGELPRPRNYIIITDGDASDPFVLEVFLAAAAETLDIAKSPKTQLGFQFIQVGKDSFATAFLERLDGDKTKYRRDIVDTVKSSSLSNNDDALVKKILLGGINRYYDHRRH